MNKGEKQKLADAYRSQFFYYLMSEGSETEKLLLQGQRQIVSLFLTNEEIKRIENLVRVNDSTFLIDLFENIESWTKTLTGNKILFDWNIQGLEWVSSELDYLQGSGPG